MTLARLSAAVAVCVCAAIAWGQQQARPLWGALEPGPHAVGFRSFWTPGNSEEGGP